MNNLVCVILLWTVNFCCIAQRDFQAIIYDDLLLLNNVYNSEIIQETQGKLILRNESDTIREMYYFSDRENMINKIVILKIDSTNGFYNVKVKLDLISNYCSFALFDQPIDFLFYKQGNTFLKVNGFFVSEICLIQTALPRAISDHVEVSNRNKNKFVRYLKRYKTDKIRRYLKANVLKLLNGEKGYFDYNPYLIKPICV